MGCGVSQTRETEDTTSCDDLNCHNSASEGFNSIRGSEAGWLPVPTRQHLGNVEREISAICTDNVPRVTGGLDITELPQFKRESTVSEHNLRPTGRAPSFASRKKASVDSNSSVSSGPPLGQNRLSSRAKPKSGVRQMMSRSSSAGGQQSGGTGLNSFDFSGSFVDDQSVSSEISAQSTIVPKVRRVIPSHGDMAECAMSVVREIITMQLPVMEIEIPDLVELPEEVEHASDWLEEMFVTRGALQSVPTVIGFFDHLRKLNLSYNQLSSFAPGLRMPESLEEIDLSHNKLTALPELSHMRYLRNINLDFNSFSTFPDALCELEQLERIFVAENHDIMTLPSVAQIGKAVALKQIAVDNVPILCKSETAARYPELLLWNKIYPDKVLDYLYIGSLRSAQTEKVYQSEGIKYVVTCGRNMQINQNNVVRMEISVEDVEGESLATHFDMFRTFMESTLGRGNVLCHCFAGLSRSATMVLSYLMSHEKMRLDTAIAKLLKIRPNIHPNPTFMLELISYDATLFPGERPLDMTNLGEERTIRRRNNATGAAAQKVTSGVSNNNLSEISQVSSTE